MPDVTQDLEAATEVSAQRPRLDRGTASWSSTAKAASSPTIGASPTCGSSPRTCSGVARRRTRHRGRAPPADGLGAFIARCSSSTASPRPESFDSFALSTDATLERFSQPWRRGRARHRPRRSFRDVTAQRRSEEKMRASEAYFRSLTEKSSDLVAVHRPRRCYPLREPVAPGSPRLQARGAGRDRRPHADPPGRHSPPARTLSAPPGAIPSFEFRLRHHDGSWRCSRPPARTSPIVPTSTGSC